jgi:hypothetical protein
MAGLVVKVEHSGELRRLAVAPPSFAALLAVVAEAWPLAAGFRLVAVDDEGDRVSVFNDASFTEAQDWARSAGKMLRLEVQAAPAAAPVAGEFTRGLFAANTCAPVRDSAPPAPSRPAIPPHRIVYASPFPPTPLQSLLQRRAGPA